MSANKDFCGLSALKEQQLRTLTKFERCAGTSAWAQIHHDHYDWWMFPIDEKSSFGYKYTLSKDNVAELKSDKEWMSNYLKGVELLFLAWGWIIRDKCFVETAGPDQKWQRYPVRLFKCIKSLQLFEISEYIDSARGFVDHLGYGAGKAIDSNQDDGNRVIRALKLPGYEKLPELPPRYR